MATGFEFELAIKRFGISPGDTPATRAVSLILHEGLRNETFGTGFDRFMLCLYFRHERPPAPGFGAAKYLAQYHQYLDELPKVTFHRKTKCIDVLAATSLSESPFEAAPAPSVTLFRELGAEVVETLRSVTPRFARQRDFDFVALLTNISALIAAAPESDVDLLSTLDKLRAVERRREDDARRADPWRALDLDWAKYHVSARTLLDDPFFWDPVDSNAPIGNDTGADILERYRSWRRARKRPNADAIAYVERILNEWGMSETDNADAQLTRDEAFIALAFVQIMFEGVLAADVAQRALRSLERQLSRATAWPDPEARRGALEKLKTKLAELSAKA